MEKNNINTILEEAIAKLERVGFLFRAISIDNNEIEGFISEPIDHLAMLGLEDADNIKKDLERLVYRF